MAWRKMCRQCLCITLPQTLSSEYLIIIKESVYESVYLSAAYSIMFSWAPFTFNSCLQIPQHIIIFILRMASSFELSSDQPKAGIYYQRARRLAGSVCKTNSWNVIQQLLIFSANSYQNLFGEPTERHRPISKKVSKTTPPEPKSRKPKPLPG